jgi:SHS2 domain-containing protein
MIQVNKKFEFLEHTADIKFRAYGKSLEEVFKNSGLALFNALTEDKVKEERKIKIKVGGEDLKSLMYNFLEEFLFLFDSKNILFSRIECLAIKKEDLTLTCEFWVDDSENYEIKNNIKAVTYSEMLVEKLEDNSWLSQVVLDV